MPARYGVADGAGTDGLDVAGYGAGGGGIPCLSAAMWLLVIKHADTQRDARGACQMTPERSVVARGTEDLVASQHVGHES